MGSCKKEDDQVPQDASKYFPPINSSDWQTASPETLGWNTSNLDSLYNYLSENGTRAFIVLKDGKIVFEHYWGKTIINIGSFNQNSVWYWASAGKTITAFLVGIAQQEGLLNINNKTSDYLGVGWTLMDPEKEALILIRNQLTMTTGLDYQVSDLDCTEPSCLIYKADAGTQWFYHNAPYTLLKDVVSNASGMSYNAFTNEKLGSKIGMTGEWRTNGSNNVYWSTARDMARFGLLILNQGSWDGKQIMTDNDYFEAMTHSSQSLNPSYGYLWWLNGQSSIRYPGLPISIKAELASNAPKDLIAGAGKNGQFVDVVPSMNLVVIRMGEAPDGSAVPIQFHNEMWKQLMPIIAKE